MNCYVRYIGVVDHQDRVHAVELKPGVNVITGKSSTGKSAMIEIFDYCFGSSDFTVPEGVITSSSQLYFIVLRFPETNLVLARKSNAYKAYIKEETNDDAIATPDMLKISYFDDAYFIGLPEFKKELGRYFGLTMVDVDEDLETRKFRYHNAKSPTPSVRSFTSFMLQHQNLVANKHAIFYRFDEKEKREQTIEHLRIFLGYADQEYFLLSQRLNGLRTELRKLEQLIPRQEDERKQALIRTNDALREYVAITGNHLAETSAEAMIDNPARWLDKIRDLTMRIDGAAEEFSRQRAEMENERSGLIAHLRALERERASVRSSIRFANEYIRNAQSIAAPNEAEITVSKCPFCNSYHGAIEDEANRLYEAVRWLNEELRRSPYLRESFEVDEHRLSKEIDIVRVDIRRIEKQVADLDTQIDVLEKGRPIGELAIKAKLRVEDILESLLEKHAATSLEEQKATIESDIAHLERQLARYEMKKKLDEASRYLEAAMADIGTRFDFEQSYRPINLHFSIESFDLWHEMEDKRRVFLRAMGSGANWLYCHLSLFMALGKLFCSLGDTCKIPPILFLDQPSQVYFPSFTIDNSQEFDAKELAAIAGKEDEWDDDMQAVENFYSQLVRFCRETLDETGVEPQIIVSDHADNLNLSDGADFKSLVRARWRTRGFIYPLPDKED